MSCGKDTAGVVWEMRGMIVSPAWPPITGTFTLDTSKSWQIRTLENIYVCVLFCQRNLTYLEICLQNVCLAHGLCPSQQFFQSDMLGQSQRFLGII